MDASPSSLVAGGRWGDGEEEGTCLQGASCLAVDRASYFGEDHEEKPSVEQVV